MPGVRSLWDLWYDEPNANFSCYIICRSDSQGPPIEENIIKLPVRKNLVKSVPGLGEEAGGQPSGAHSTPRPAAPAAASLPVRKNAIFSKPDVRLFAGTVIAPPN